MSGQSFGGASVDDDGGLLPAGWWRVTLTGTLPGGGVSVVIGVLGPTGARTFAGDGSSGVLVWGPNLTQGLDARPFALTQGSLAGAQIFNPPAALTRSSRETWAALAGGPHWGGADVYVSLDGGSTYELVGSTTEGPSRFGQLTASFASGSDPDAANTCSVDLAASASGDPNDNASGVLTPADPGVADGAGTLCLINDATPELVSFSAAPLAVAPNISPYRFDLGAYIRRGQLGTPISVHGAGAPFIRLDAAPFDFPFLAPNVGQAVFAKFASFNKWGQATTPLQNCIAYPFTPAASAAGAPGGSAWSADGGALSNAGQAIPAILITGASDNPSAQQVVFFYRPHGSGQWLSAGAHPIATTSYAITSVAPGASYDVGVAYTVQGSLGQIQVIASPTAHPAGSLTSSGSGAGGAGTVLFDSSDPSVNAYTCQAGTYGHVDIEIWGADGGIFWRSWYPEPFDRPGGAGAYAKLTGTAVTPGTTVINFSLGAAGSDAGASHGGGTSAAPGAGSSVTTPAITVGGGGGATTLANGAGGAVGAGGAQTPGAPGAGFGANGRIRITAQS